MHIEQWSECLITKQFIQDPRAGLPETNTGATPLPHVPAGVPASMRSSLYRNLRRSSFPYGRAAESTGELVPRELRFVSIVSDRFRVTVCPDLGGRVMSMLDRHHSTELLWNQPALHGDVFGLAGAWFVGGLEFNANRFGHLVHGQTTLRLSIVGSSATPDALILSAVDEAFGCSWEATISPESNRIVIHLSFKNHSSSSAPAYWWSNIAVPAHRHIRVLMQPGPALHHGVYRPGFDTDRWPHLQGADWSRWLNQHEISSIYLHEPSDGFMGYLNERRGLAFVHHADPAICRGRKLWTIGSGADRVSWWSRLAEPALPSYYEMQCGLAPTQLQAPMIEAGETIKWTESYGLIPFAADTDERYEEIWRRFARDAKQLLTENAAPLSTQRQTLIEPAERQQWSETIVLNRESVADEEVHRICERGWVAGDAWIGRLRKLGTHTGWTKVALGAALLDQGTPDQAIDVLRSCANLPDAVGGWASLLIGRELKRQRMLVEAMGDLQWAVQYLPDRTEPWSELIRLLLEQGDVETASERMKKAPAQVAMTDSGCVLRALIALSRGEWKLVQDLTEAEFHSTAEGEIEAWTLRKESFVGQAFELEANGHHLDAIERLIAGGRLMPQFGTGRDEFTGNGDLLFYRWVLASRNANRWAADSIARMILETELHPGLNDAVYAARLAKLTNDPSHHKRRKEIDAWNADAAGNSNWPVLRDPIMRAMDGDPSGFEALRVHPIYKHRARAEVDWICRWKPS